MPPAAARTPHELIAEEGTCRSAILPTYRIERVAPRSWRKMSQLTLTTA
jgi:hypothetical protein